MRSKKLITLCALSGLSLLAQADMPAKPSLETKTPLKFYVKATGGAIKPSKRDDLSYKWGWQGRMAIGAEFRKNWNVELEVGHARSNAEGKIITNYINLSAWESSSGMVNLIYNHSFTDTIYGYVGAGAGAAHTSYKESYDSTYSSSASRRSDTTFAYQALAGVGYKINDNWALQAGYRICNSTKVRFATIRTVTQNNEFDIKQPFVHSIEAGIKYTF